MSVSNIANIFQNYRDSKNFENQKKLIHVAARTSQIFFGLGCVISVIGVYLHLTPLVTGGSFLYNTAIITFRAAEGVICYDAAVISSNIASIFSSSCIPDFLKKNISNENAKAILLPIAENVEKHFTLPKELLKKLAKPKDLANAITHNTLVAKSFNSSIEKFLSR